MPSEFALGGQTYRTSQHLDDYRKTARAYITDELLVYVLLEPDESIRQGNRTVHWRYVPGLPCVGEVSVENRDEPGRGCFLKVVIGPSRTVDFSVITAYADHSRHIESLEEY